MTRIVAGAAGGRRLVVPSSARPTTDRVREALFNVLAARLVLTGLRVLDLFAGSGALGLEALSRGAQSVLFVEADRRAADVIARNIETVGLPGATVRRASVASLMKTPPDAPMDLVLADPPYDVDTPAVEALLSGLQHTCWVVEGGVVVVERPVSSEPLRWPAGWTAWPVRRYGDTRLEGADVGAAGISDC